MSNFEPSSQREALETRRQQKRVARRKQWLRISAYALIVALLGAGVVYYLAQRGTEGLSIHVEGEVLPVRNRLLILIMGMDAVEPNHTDTIMLASLNSRTGHVGVLSIPRDTRVQIPGRSGYHRINAAHAYGGPETTVRTVESLLGVTIDHWVRVQFDGFRQVVDTVGGVEINIPRAMVYTDKAQDLYINLQPGQQRLDGERALQYVRFRADGLGDVVLADPLAGVYKGRVDRQLEFVRALAKEALQPANLLRAPLVIPQLMKAVDTNLPLDRALRLVGTLGQINLERMETVVLPGVSETIGGASYWVANMANTKEAVNRVLLGRHQMVQVAVLNGNGTAGIATQVAQRLRSDGFFVGTVGNADRYNYPYTRVIPVNGRAEDAERVASLLGGRVEINGALPPAVRGTDVDLVVVIGLDYKSPQ